jgi:hypothetical protein
MRAFGPHHPDRIRRTRRLPRQPLYARFPASFSPSAKAHFPPLGDDRSSRRVRPPSTDCVEEPFGRRGRIAVETTIGSGEMSPFPHVAKIGAGSGMSFASFLRFWAVAASRNSSLAPFGPRRRNRSSFRMRSDERRASRPSFVAGARQRRHRSLRLREPDRERPHEQSVRSCVRASLLAR